MYNYWLEDCEVQSEMYDYLLEDCEVQSEIYDYWHIDNRGL